MVSKPSDLTMESPTMSTYNYRFAPGYGYHSAQPAPVSGYPYIPHNATTQEREACSIRMHAIRARAQPVRSGNLNAEAYRLHSGTKTSWVDVQARRSPSPEPSTEVYSSSEEESSGPETPHYRSHFVWNDSFDDAPEREHFNHPHPHGTNVHSGPYKYYPPAPPVIPEEERTSESAPDTFTTTISSATRKELQQLTYQFNTLVLGFKFPSNLEFTSPSNSGELPKLAHTPASKPLLEHTHALEKLLEKVDAVESYGDEAIRGMRKQVVERMLSELEGLKRMEAMALYNFNYERDDKA